MIRGFMSYSEEGRISTLDFPSGKSYRLIYPGMVRRHKEGDHRLEHCKSHEGKVPVARVELYYRDMLAKQWITTGQVLACRKCWKILKDPDGAVLELDNDILVYNRELQKANSEKGIAALRAIRHKWQNAKKA